MSTSGELTAAVQDLFDGCIDYDFERKVVAFVAAHVARAVREALTAAAEEIDERATSVRRGEHSDGAAYYREGRADGLNEASTNLLRRARAEGEN